MRTLHWLETHLPRRVWDNLATVSILGMLAVLALFATLILNLIHENRLRANEGRQAHDALCVSRSNLEERIHQTQVFLDNGGQIPGVPRTILVSGLNRDKATLKALSVLSCDKPKGAL